MHEERKDLLPGKLATINPIAPPLNPPTTLQNFPVGVPPFSAIPSSLSISSKTSPNCSFSNFCSSSGFFALELNPKLLHGNPLPNPPAPPLPLASALMSGISSSESKAVEAVLAPEPKPW